MKVVVLVPFEPVAGSPLAGTVAATVVAGARVVVGTFAPEPASIVVVVSSYWADAEAPNPKRTTADVIKAMANFFMVCPFGD